jgi:predicted GIY-YIG superfamily endonuclease
MVYIIHFVPKYFRAQHYVGFTADTERRLLEHLAMRSSGSPLVKAVLQSGSTVTMSKIYPDGDRILEKAIKRQKNTHRFCPLCQAKKQNNNTTNQLTTFTNPKK